VVGNTADQTLSAGGRGSRFSLYWDQGCTRDQADAIFRVAMAESNVKPFERDLMWEAVRKFGQSAWNDNAAAKQAGKPRIIPTAYMTIPPLVTWTDYQIQLMAQGVKPAPSPPTYCSAGTSATLRRREDVREVLCDGLALIRASSLDQSRR
jgi:hypothetical protein